MSGGEFGFESGYALNRLSRDIVGDTGTQPCNFGPRVIKFSAQIVGAAC